MEEIFRRGAVEGDFVEDAGFIVVAPTDLLAGGRGFRVRERQIDCVGGGREGGDGEEGNGAYGESSVVSLSRKCLK